MRNLLPLLLVLAVFPFSFYAKRRLETPLGILLPSAAMIFFMVMAFVDTARMYPHLFFAMLAAVLALRSAKSSGLVDKFYSNSRRGS